MQAARFGLVSLLLLSAPALANPKFPVPAPTTRSSAESFTATDQALNIDGVAPRDAAWLKRFDHKPETFTYTVQLITVEDDLRLYRVTFPSPFTSPWPENNVVPCELYLPKTIDGHAPAAIVLDILDGSAVLARGMARGLAEQGVIALYMPMATFGARRPPGNAHLIAFRDDPNKAIDNVRQTVMDIRRAKALLASRPDVDPHRIGITGISLGGIITALAAGVDGSFDRVVPILAGGDLPDIIFHARETRLLRTAMEAHGIDRKASEALLAPIDPLTFAKRIGAQKCLMINASKDEVIPRATTDALAKAIGSPTVLWTPLGHYTSILYLPNIRQRAIDFLQGKPVEKLAF